MLSKFSFFRKDEILRDYRVTGTLGKGSFATVKRATSLDDGTDWAVKIIDKTKLAADDEAALKVEVEILQKVDHPNIVRMKQVYDCPKVFYMVMELMTGGELYDRVVAKGKFDEEQTRRVVTSVARALQYCHAMGIVHRDLKPENLLYTSHAEDADIKIADFGLAKLIKREDLMTTQCGTPGYVAPEILSGEIYSEKVDLWSLGVITYILLCGFPPFYDENTSVMFAHIKAGDFDFPSPEWDEVSPDAKHLILRLLVVDPSHRLSAKQVLEHPWVTNLPLPEPEPLSPVAAPPAPILARQPSLKRGGVSSRNMTNRAITSTRGLSDRSAVSAGGVEPLVGAGAGAGAGAEVPSTPVPDDVHALASATADAVKSVLDGMMATVHANVESAYASQGMGPSGSPMLHGA